MSSKLQNLEQQVLDLEPQYAYTLSSATIKRALSIINCTLTIPTMEAALRLVKAREYAGYWRQGEAPAVVWEACIVIWRLQDSIRKSREDRAAAARNPGHRQERRPRFVRPGSAGA